MTRDIQDVKQDVLAALNEDESKPFEEFGPEIQGPESVVRTALLDLVDENRVIPNAQWEYRLR